MKRLSIALLGGVLMLSCWPGRSAAVDFSDYDEYIVRSRPGTALVQSNLLAGLKGAQVTQLRSGADYYLIRAPRGQQASLLSRLNRASSIMSYQPNYRYQALFAPNDPSYPLQWNLPVVNAPAGWDVDSSLPLYGGDPSVIVAVVDTGVAYENYGTFQAMPDFSGTAFVVGTDVINGDAHANDDVGHGTHVAATIAQATNNLQAGAGIAFNSTIMPIKVLDDSGVGTTLDIAAGIDFAREHGADVINLSLGGASDDPFLHLAIQAAANAGITIVAAAGNQASAGLFYPARYDEVISVAATGPANTLAPYSNYGPGLDLVAPGGDMTSNASHGILQMTCQTGAPTAVPCTTDVSPTFAEIYYEGTSQATPHVSAAAALLIAAGVSPTNVRSVLIGSAHDLGPAGYDTSYGWGLLDISRALSVGLNDVVPPTGTVGIQASAAFTSSTIVDLQVSASDDQSTVVAMSFSNDGTT
ncbi:MAG: S8 family serine peptidase, partial [Candidatus Kerfeldbacteria bacterium]|nr:S8 family serine peptidase [Candidatus Kerfeldbacteria bacterium]